MGDARPAGSARDKATLAEILGAPELGRQWHAYGRAFALPLHSRRPDGAATLRHSDHVKIRPCVSAGPTLGAGGAEGHAPKGVSACQDAMACGWTPTHKGGFSDVWSQSCSTIVLFPGPRASARPRTKHAGNLTARPSIAPRAISGPAPAATAARGPQRAVLLPPPALRRDAKALQGRRPRGRQGEGQCFGVLLEI
jgi:hypothetical protein